MAVTNPEDTPVTYYLELVKDAHEGGKPIYVESEVKIKMDDVLYNAWQRGGEQTEEMENTTDTKKKKVNDNHALLKNIDFDAKEAGFLSLDFSFLTEEMTDKETYVYHLIQKKSTTGEIVGGETFEIHKESRPVFYADAADKEGDLNESITLSAVPIGEPASYKWYDMQGNLLHEGMDYNIILTQDVTYKLEVTAEADGFKDYKEVHVNLKPNRITGLSPNPASGMLNITYRINDGADSSLMLIGAYGGDGTTAVYPLDINDSQISIDVSALQSGYYSIALLSNGQILDSQIFQKQ